MRIPISLAGLYWPVTITDKHMQIGCEMHTFSDWDKFKGRRIKAMDTNALEFWKELKSALMALCRSHEAKIKEGDR